MADRKEMLKEQLAEYPEALDRDQVAEVLGISRRKVDDLVEKEILPSFVVDPNSQKKQVKINKSDLMLYMLNQVQEQA